MEVLMTVLRTCIAVTAACFLFTGAVAAQQPPQEKHQHERAKTPEPVTGELLSLNTDTRTLVIKTTADTEMKFTFSENTEIVGADKGVSGLATIQGTTVTVTYDVHGTANIATKIEVLPKKK
jgi:hypothetical protein